MDVVWTRTWLDRTMSPLTYRPALSQHSLLAPPVSKALESLPGADEVQVAEIDPQLSDTAAFCAEYGVTLEESANCVVIAGKRGGEVSYAACVILATTRADVNGAVRKHLGVRKASFGSVETVTSLTSMEYGGITPIGLPESWPVLIDDRVARASRVVIGSGIRGSKLWLPGRLLAGLPGAEVLPGLAS
jgi:prolyl-tRNA editing enzyme YbaK/EbsC (Cys-tRNA(Pro) deacylase)